jgi:hypothetical protein
MYRVDFYHTKLPWIRVARWYICKPKIQIWVNVWPLGLFYCPFVNFIAILVFFPVLVYCTYREKSGNPALDGGVSANSVRFSRTSLQCSSLQVIRIIIACVGVNQTWNLSSEKVITTPLNLFGLIWRDCSTLLEVLDNICNPVRAKVWTRPT